MYGKLFVSMYEGSLYGNWEAIVTFQQMICLANRDGVVDMTPTAIAGKTSIPLEIIERGIAHLVQPDPESRSPECDGRRIETLDLHRSWGWRIVNYEKYRRMGSMEDKLMADRDRIKQKRRDEKANKIQDVAMCRKVSRGVSNVAQVEVEVEVEVEKKEKDMGWDHFLQFQDSPSRTLFQQIEAAVSSTRKSGKVAASVLNHLAVQFQKFPLQAVLSACQIYLDRNYAAEDKGEKYLVGIVRGEQKRLGSTSVSLPATTQPQMTPHQRYMQRLLQEQFREQAEREATAKESV